MPQLSIALLGPPRCEVDGHRIEINRRKAVALLAYLAVSGRSHSRDTLATLLWPEANQTRARAALRSALWALNTTALSDWLLVDAETVTLRTSAAQTLAVDTIHFSGLLDSVQRHDHATIDHCDGCLTSLTQAVALYEDDFMAGFTLADTPDFDEWQFFQADSLRQQLATALAALINIHRARGAFGDAIPYARRHVAFDPLHESAQRTLMQLYAQDGQPRAALRQYDICRAMLDDELGIEPADATHALAERIRSGRWQTDAQEVDAVNAVRIDARADSQPPKVVLPHNLPPPSSPLIGRERELADVAAFLDDPATRLLTIVGPGGIGKTRLSLAVAADQLTKTNFPDGVYLVRLAALTDPDAITPAIAEAIGYHFLPDQRTPPQQLIDYLSQRTALLLLDNLEQLLSGQPADGAALVAELLQNAPHLKILTTSRERLNLYEEQRYPLHGLAIADDDAGDADVTYAAASLFLQRARRQQPNFELAPADAPHLATICRLVEGMPLALELAAAGLEALSLRAIAAEIRENLDFLATDVRNVPDRHRSMQAVFDASWHALNEPERRTFAQLSVLRGGFTLAAAKAVTGASRRALGGLVNKSLLRFDQARQRYEIHELLRQYGAEQLGDAGDAARDRHAAHYSAFLRQCDAELKGPQQRAALAAIEADSENCRTAWQWAVARSQIVWLDHALTPLARYYRWLGRMQDGETICRLAAEKLAVAFFDENDELLATPWTPARVDQARVLVHVLTWQSIFDIHLHQYADARHAQQRGQRMLDTPALADQRRGVTQAFLLLQQANLAGVSDFGGNAIELLEESLALYRAADDEWGAASVLDALGQNYMNLGQHETARELQEECLTIRERLDDPRNTARSYNLLGLLVLHIGEIERSEAYLRKSLALYRTMDNPAGLGVPLAMLGINLLFGGKFEECIAAYEESWALHRRFGIPQGPFLAEVTTTRARINLGRYAEARSQAEADLAKFRAIDHPWSIAFTLYNLGRIDLVEDAAEQAHTRLQESAEILQTMNERSLLPDVLFCLAYAQRAGGEAEEAKQTIVQALDLVIATGPLNPMRFELPGMALLQADAGEPARAVELHAAALQSSYIANSRWFADFAGKAIADVAAALPPDVVTEARARGQARDLWVTANEIQTELRGT